MQLPNFYVGVWAQPVESFPKWKAEGINLIVKPDQTNNNSAHDRRMACAASGFFYIDQPTDAADALALVNDPWCIGLMYPDEPSNNAPWYSSDPAGFAAYVASYNAIWTPILSPAHGKKMIWCNFAGGHLLGARPWQTGQQVIPFATLADVVCQDTYPINQNVAGDWDQWNAGIGLPVGLNNAPVDPLAVGTTYPQYALRLLKQYFPGKPTWSYVETCKYDANPLGRQPTGAEIQAEVTSMLKDGLKSLVYFVHNLTGPGWNPAGAAGTTNWDGRNADQVAACKEITATLTSSNIPVPIPPTPTDLGPLTARVAALEGRMTALEAKAITDGMIVSIAKHA